MFVFKLIGFAIKYLYGKYAPAYLMNKAFLVFIIL